MGSCSPGPTPAGSRHPRSYGAARLVPLYLLALVAAVIVDIGLHTGLTGKTALPSFFGLQSWLSRDGFAFAANGPGWSLSDEMFFYLLFPLLLPLLTRLPRTGRLPLVGALIAVELAVAAVTGQLHGYSATYWSYLFPPLRLCEFAAGITLALHVRDGWRPPISAHGAGVLFLLAYAGSGFAPAVWQSSAITFLPVCLVVCTLAADDVSGRPGRLLARPSIVRLGNWSFAFYLVHQMPIMVLSRVGDHGPVSHSPIRGIGLSLIALAAALVAAKVLHERFEIPLEARWGGSRRSAHDVVAAPGGAAALPAMRVAPELGSAEIPLALDSLPIALDGA